MKKIIVLFLVLLLMSTMVACGNNVEVSDISADNQQSSETESNKTVDNIEDLDGKLGTFNKNATIEETVMVDEGGMKITATGLNYDNYSVELELTIENNTDKNLSFHSGSVGYSCNSINGYMISGGYLNCDVVAGKKANDSIKFNYDELMLYGINEIADIEIGFSVSDDHYKNTYTGPRQVKTSAFDSHDYNINHYQKTIASRMAMNTYQYDMKYFSQDTLYDSSGVKIVSSGVLVKEDGDSALLLELENTTNNIVYVSTSDIAFNGLMVYGSTWSSDAINPGKRGIIDVDLSSVFDRDYWNVYGIDEIGSISLALSQRDFEGTELAEKGFIKIAIPNAKGTYDLSGKEIYNSSGLRIMEKSILEDPSEFNSDVHVFLLAENKSGKTLEISDVYRSVSVNGFMTDYFWDDTKIRDGESAVLEIELRESSLAENKINSVSDIKEVEARFEVQEGDKSIDEVMMKLSFN